MKTTVETLEQIRRENGNCSDYRIAQLKGIGRNYVSVLLHKDNKMTEVQRIKAAELLHEDPELHLIYRSIERAKNTDAKKTWMHTLKRLNATAAAVVLAVGLWIPSQDVLAGGFYEVTSYTLCAYVTRKYHQI